MAADSDNPAEIKAHVESYARFAGLMKWGTILSFIVAAFVVLIIA